MLVDVSFEGLLEEYLQLAPQGVDTRQGSIYYDAGAGFLFLLNRFYTDLNFLYERISLSSAEGKFLDDKGRDFGEERHQASPALYSYTYEVEAGGAAPQIGDRFFFEGHFFVLEPHKSETVLRAEELGSSENYIEQGSAAVPVESALGLRSLLFDDLIEAGRDAESDEDFRGRIREKLAGPAENGNKQHYKTWCKQIDRLGSARILSLNPDINHIKAIILGLDGGPADEDLLRAVQEKIDPNKNGDGSGLANIGAIFTAAPPTPLVIDVKVKIFRDNDEFTQQGLRRHIEDYFKKVNLEAAEEDYFISTSRLGYEIFSMDSVKDYENLEIRVGGNSLASVLIGSEEVAMLGSLDVTE